MQEPVILLSIPGLREKDLAAMPRLRALAKGGLAALAPSFPAVTCPVQANMTTGATPDEHGVIANGLYHRDKHEVEMWTSWNECIQRPQIWEQLKQKQPEKKSAAWFPLNVKGATADLICTPAPIHNPDGSESLWCYTKPQELYGQLRDDLGHFPLKHFWGPIANIESTKWIVASVLSAAKLYHPDFLYIYLPHLDYSAQRTGPDSPPAQKAVQELDEVLGLLEQGITAAYTSQSPLWLVASEYTILPVDHVTYPNRALREAGLLQVKAQPDGEHLDFVESAAFAMVDHQFSHVFVRDHDEATIARVEALFKDKQGIDEVLRRDQLDRYDLIHERSGDLVLVSKPNSWQAYYWWLSDDMAPGFARTVDIHKKPGYDPVELHFDMATKSIPLNASLVKGSHGAPAHHESQRGVILASEPGVLASPTLADTDVCALVLQQFGI